MEQIDRHKLTGFLKSQFQKDNLKVELISDQAIRFSYYYKMKYEVKTIKELLASMIMIEQDKTILDSLPLSYNQKLFLRQSLLVNSVVTYAKFFISKSEDQALISHIKLQEKDCYKNEAEPIFTMHEKIMQTRHKCFSHGVQNEHEHIIPYMYLFPIHGTLELNGRLGINSVGIINFSLTELRLFETVVEKLAIYLEKKLDDLTTIVYKEYEDVPADKWFETAIKREAL